MKIIYHVGWLQHPLLIQIHPRIFIINLLKNCRNIIGILLIVFTSNYLQAEVGEEVELSSGVITALSCAKESLATGKLDLLTSCPLAEAQAGFVVFDVAEKKIYKLANTKVYIFELARAFGGGSIDFTGKIINEKDGVAEVEVTEYSVTPKAKPGSFKGCL